MPVSVLLENHFQNCYVTADLDLGIATLKEQYGIAKFKVLSRGEGPGQRVRTPHGEGDLVVKAGVAILGNLTIELMEPVSGPVEIFREFLVPGLPLRLHHIGLYTDDIEGVRDQNERLGRPVVMEGGYAGGGYAYIDARATLGHYLEYVWPIPDYYRR
jgi:hypothetical protein